MSERNIPKVGLLAGARSVGTRKYDLFELFPDGYVLWRGTINGLKKAMIELQELAAQTKHEVQLMYAPNNVVIAKRNVPLLHPRLVHPGTNEQLRAPKS
jgi:hypothetical protein